MADLLTEKGSAYQLNIRVFNLTQHTITGWPGGKPNADDTSRPERASPHPKRALVLSPEPMDDVFSMGGTLHRLANQGHELALAYQTSGSLAVPDSDLRRALDLILKLGEQTGARTDTAFAGEVEKQLEEKGEFGSDTADIRRIKALIREGEALSSARSLGLDESCVRFLRLPFYEEGRYRRFARGENDAATVAALLDEIRPHQIFATGFDQDPLSVPSLCFRILREALESRKDADWFADCRVWLYKGLGAEWEAHEIDMAVPLSPAELAHNINGIYQHLTQRSQRPSSSRQGERETWALAERLNRNSATVYDSLGLAEYEAIEGFRRWSRNSRDESRR
jgi:glucosamine-6-phosphate deaminase